MFQNTRSQFFIKKEAFNFFIRGENMGTHLGKALFALCAGLFILLPVNSSIAANYHVGVNYHTTSSYFAAGNPSPYDNDGAGFIRFYNQPEIRALVQQQLQAMANAGADTILTGLWSQELSQFTTTSASVLTFPFTQQEVANIRQYALDVVGTKSQVDGHCLHLQFKMLWTGDADFTQAKPDGGVGYHDISWADFITYARESISGLLGTSGLAGITNGDGTQILVYLNGEVQWNYPNTEDFLTALYPYFTQQASAANIAPSVYFMTRFDLADIENGTSLVDAQTTYNFMVNSGMTLPSRIDFSFYPGIGDPTFVYSPSIYATLVSDFSNEFQNRFPGHSMGIAETFYLTDPAQRLSLGQAFASIDNINTQTLFWPTPYTNVTVPTDLVAGPAVVGAPFDFSAYMPGQLITANPNPCFSPDSSSTCTTTIYWAAPATTQQIWVTQTDANGNITTPASQFTCITTSGSQSAPWIIPGYNDIFNLYPGCNDPSSPPSTSNSLSSVKVTALTPVIFANPNPCVPSFTSNQCTSNIEWEADQNAQVWVSEDGAPGTLFASSVASGGIQAAPWIQNGHTYDFQLYPASSCSSTECYTSPIKDVSVSAGPPPSASGTIMPWASQIIDTYGNVWTLSGGLFYENGSVRTSSVTQWLLYYNGTIYAQNSGNTWFSWNGANWVSVGGDPRPSGNPGASASGTIMPWASRIIDTYGNVWTLSGGLFYENGSVRTSVTQWLLYYNGTIYAQNSGNTWFSWNGATWVSVGGDPRPSGNPGASASGTIMPWASRIIDTYGNVWTRSGGLFYENGSGRVSSSVAQWLLYYNNTIYGEISGNIWYSWNGATWVSVSGDPRPSGNPNASASGTIMPSASQIIDTYGNVWTLLGGLFYENGSVRTSSATQWLGYYNNTIYALNIGNSWYSWNGANWVYLSGGDPRPSVTATPNPCVAPAGGSCTVTVNWKSSNLTEVWYQMDQNTPKPVSCGVGGSQNASVQPGHTFILTLYNASACTVSGRFGTPIASFTLTS